MAIYTFRTSTYARNIYLYGTERLTERDETQADGTVVHYNGVPSEYYVPVEQYAAANFRLDQIDNALAQGWINQQEYDETMAYAPTTNA